MRVVAVLTLMLVCAIISAGATPPAPQAWAHSHGGPGPFKTCASYDCAQHSTMLRAQADKIHCPISGCTTAHCCASSTCESYTCQTQGFVLRPNYKLVSCPHKSGCDDGRCCAQTCATSTSPIVCPNGFRPNYQNLTCHLSGCTVGHCCAPGTCSYEDNVDYFGNDISDMIVEKATAADCCAYCHSIPTCTCWSYWKDTKTCFPKTSIGGRGITTSLQNHPIISGFISTVPTNGLVAYYPFNGNANDASGNGLHGTPMNVQLTSDRFGHADAAYSFNGMNGYVVIGEPVPTLLRIQNAFTFSAWIKYTAVPTTWKMIVGCQADTNAQGLNLQMAGSPAGSILSQPANFQWWSTYTSSIVPTNQWVHIVSTQAAHAAPRVYFNGVLQTIVYVNTPAPLWDGSVGYTGTEFAIGRHKEHNDRYFQGFIDDVRVYNRTLTDTEVLALYHE